KRVRFFRVTEIITQLMEAREERDLQRLRKQLAKLDLLILDELGYVPGICPYDQPRPTRLFGCLKCLMSSSLLQPRILPVLRSG
ncbi:MAG: ATP-binding protein, partial [Fuerstiella sp.]|nr:ATP-binding protein [Fuerstiella sp.]MCP4858810.1 ATP-binding protein [Fuerstiella sp.]